MCLISDLKVFFPRAKESIKEDPNVIMAKSLENKWKWDETIFRKIAMNEYQEQMRDSICKRNKVYVDYDTMRIFEYFLDFIANFFIILLLKVIGCKFQFKLI